MRARASLINCNYSTTSFENIKLWYGHRDTPAQRQRIAVPEGTQLAAGNDEVIGAHRDSLRIASVRRIEAKQVGEVFRLD